MRRKDYVIKERAEFANTYRAITCDDTDKFFSRSNCDCCQERNLEVVNVTYRTTKGISVDGEMCWGCLVGITNDDHSDLDFDPRMEEELDTDNEIDMER